MEIKDARNEINSTFANLSLGDVFEYDGAILMKVEEVKQGCGVFNAIYLKDGDLERFDPEDIIVPLVVQLHIIRNG